MASLGREGFTFDTVLSVIRKTALNPAITIPLYVASLYTAKGREQAALRPKAAEWLKALSLICAMRTVSNFLDKGVLNNWQNDSYDWQKEIVVVTGGSDGIGARVVHMLAAKNIKVVVLDIQEPQYDVPANVHYYHCDLANPKQIHEVAASISKDVGAPSIVVANAGFARGNTILGVSQTDLNLTFQINTLSHYHLCQAFLPAMIKNNHGNWITVASLAGYATSPGLVDYSASKAAAVSFHEGLSAELVTKYAAPAVRTVLVCQTYTRTALFQGFETHDGFLNYPLHPDTVAEAIVTAILKGQSDHIILPVGMSIVPGLRNWPGWLQALQRKRAARYMTNWQGRQVVQPSEESKKSVAISANETTTPIDNLGKSLETSAVLL